MNIKNYLTYLLNGARIAPHVLHRQTDWTRGLVQGEVLLLSRRRIADHVGHCLAYEFEDSVAAVADAQRVDADGLLATLKFARRAYKLVRLAS